MQASGTPVQQVREHKKIIDEIDEMYMDTVYAVSNVQANLVWKGGRNRIEQFKMFYRSFYALFSHTRYMKGVDDADINNVTEESQGVGNTQDEESPPDEIEIIQSRTLTEKIERWFIICESGVGGSRGSRLLKIGVRLFSKYQKRLINKGVITIAK
jgi:hypothetical protein